MFSADKSLSHQRFQHDNRDLDEFAEDSRGIQLTRRQRDANGDLASASANYNDELSAFDRRKHSFNSENIDHPRSGNSVSNDVDDATDTELNALSIVWRLFRGLRKMPRGAIRRTRNPPRRPTRGFPSPPPPPPPPPPPRQKNRK
jgi:hypothetical protein